VLRGFSQASERPTQPASAFLSQEELTGMRNPVPNPDASRTETVVAALIYLMTHYARTGCPRLALCVSRHMQCLAAHPDAAPVVRDICASLHGAWSQAAGAGQTPPGAMH
jgi:hypothetical protein